jgi:hypothetical protein
VATDEPIVRSRHDVSTADTADRRPPTADTADTADCVHAPTLPSVA